MSSVRFCLLSMLLLLTSLASAQIIQDPNLVGTWTTKSWKVFTGPDFYNPVTERFNEPSVTGISYSFTQDGYYEEAYYRAVSNPTTPACPKGIIQWQHGKYNIYSNGSIVLTPIAVDGRQVFSDPCAYQESVYTRYSQYELIKKYEVVTDRFHNVRRLNLYQFDGAPLNPMFLAYNPPQMLPTQTLNPTTTGPVATSISTSSAKEKRSFEEKDGDYYASKPLNARLFEKRHSMSDPDTIWWISIGLIGLGSIGYLCF